MLLGMKERAVLWKRTF